MSFDLFDFFFTILEVLGRWSSTMFDWLFTDVTLLGETFKPIWALGGSVAVILLTAYLVKTFVPMA